LPYKRGESALRAVTGELRDVGTQRVLLSRVVRAIGPIARTIGLLGRSKMDDDEALWFDSCSAIHTLGMRMPIDVLFLDHDATVIRVVRRAKPWLPWIGARRARNVLELAGGACERVGITSGMQLEVRWDSHT
jgi:uncharacterized protein